MRAVVLHGPGDLRVEDVADPSLPPGGLIISVAAVGICGSDVRVWRHGSPRLRGPQVPGHEVAGVVIRSDAGAYPAGMPVTVVPGAPCGTCRACRRDAGNLCPTRRVIAYDLPGGMAEAMAVPADWVRVGGVVALPSDRPTLAGALVEPLHTVINGQDHVGVGPEDRVLILGLGPIGVLHAAYARSLGARVHAIDPDADRVTVAVSVLSGVTVDRLHDDWAERARGSLDAGGADVVIVAVGRREAFEAALAEVAAGGRILAFAGFPPDAATLELDGNDLHYRQITIAGAFGGTPATFRRAADWLVAHPLDLDRIAPSRFALEDAGAAFASAEAGRGLKTLLLPGVSQGWRPSSSG